MRDAIMGVVGFTFIALFYLIVGHDDVKISVRLMVKMIIESENDALGVAKGKRQQNRWIKSRKWRWGGVWRWEDGRR